MFLFLLEPNSAPMRMEWMPLNDRYSGGLEDDEEEEEDEDEDEDEVGSGPAGLFQGDAGARLASLTLKDEDSDDEDGAAAVAPFHDTAAAADDDEVVLEDSDEEEDNGDSGGVGSSPAHPKSPTQLLKATSSPVASPTKSPKAAAVEEEEKAEYNSYQFWSSGIDDSLVPDDI